MGTTTRPKKASKTDDAILRDYELILIVSPDVGDDALDTTIDNISRLITGKGGTIANVERWGRRKLAYPIKRSMEGNYVVVQFKLGTALTKELEANLKISEEVLRHLLIRNS
ncbi:MAG TPA: 30S ribosomal protein S6 [Dehalococcoidia bacterium]|nr:30S ribosomal protein S6 [Dehalococcoidia bacterium]